MFTSTVQCIIYSYTHMLLRMQNSMWICTVDINAREYFILLWMRNHRDSDWVLHRVKCWITKTQRRRSWSSKEIVSMDWLKEKITPEKSIIMVKSVASSVDFPLNQSIDTVCFCQSQVSFADPQHENSGLPNHLGGLNFKPINFPCSTHTNQ